MNIELRVLGGFDLTFDGCNRSALPKKGKALLAHLACAGTEVSRSVLADLLWPLQDEEQARHSLRNLLLEIRKRHADVIASNFGSCWIGVGVVSDVARFKALCKNDDYASLVAAADLYAGELLTHFNLDASEPWNEWIRTEREVLENAARSCCLRLADEALSRDDKSLAIVAVRRATEVDYYNELAQQRQYELLNRVGLSVDAERKWREFGERLRREYGVNPELPTTDSRMIDLSQATIAAALRRQKQAQRKARFAQDLRTLRDAIAAVLTTMNERDDQHHDQAA